MGKNWKNLRIIMWRVLNLDEGKDSMEGLHLNKENIRI